MRYPGAVHDPGTGAWISDAQVAETAYTASASTADAVTARLIVRRVKDTATTTPRARGGGFWRSNNDTKRARIDCGRTSSPEVRPAEMAPGLGDWSGHRRPLCIITQAHVHPGGPAQSRRGNHNRPSPLPRPDDPIDPDRTIGLTRTPVPVGKHRYRLASCIDGC